VEIKLSLLETEEGLWGCAAIRDLTERRKLEQQFRQAQKMGVYRDAGGRNRARFQQPADGNPELRQFSDRRASEEFETSARGRADLLSSGNAGAALTSQMLAFSRKQVFQLRVVNLNDIVRNLLKMLQRIIGEHIEIKMMLAEDLVRVRADAGQLEQVLMNLSVNARRCDAPGRKD